MPGFYLVNSLQGIVLKVPDEAQKGKRKDMFLQAERTMREWLRKSFPNRLLESSYGYRNFNNVLEIEVGIVYVCHTYLYTLTKEYICDVILY